MRRIAKSAFLLVLVCFAVLAQEDRGTMRGRIKDPTGAIVPNASVTAVNVATNNQFKTSEHGRIHDSVAAGGKLPPARRESGL
jgi:hypothetical protein